MYDVLLIEDNHFIRYMVQEILESRGIVTAIAEDGLSGLRLAKDLKPRLVLLDMGLPVMGGLEVVEILKSDPAFKDIKIIAISGSITPADVEKFLNAGCDDYLAKPFQIHQLVEKVKRHLKLEEGI